MGKYEVNKFPKLDKDKLIDILTDELPVLRAKIDISQDETSYIIGISRQSYSAIENKKRQMSWTVFLDLILFFAYNEKNN